MSREVQEVDLRGGRRGTAEVSIEVTVKAGRVPCVTA